MRRCRRHFAALGMAALAAAASVLTAGATSQLDVPRRRSEAEFGDEFWHRARSIPVRGRWRGVVGEPEVLMEGIVFGESPRWHDGRVWFSDWGANQVIALGTDGHHEVVVTVASFPMCIDFLPDGRLLVVDSAQRRLLRREAGGSLVQHADLSPVSQKPWNDIVVDDRGNAYVNTIGFDFPGGQFAPGLIVLVTPDGTVEQVAGGLAFPNGMAISPDGGMLIVARVVCEPAHRLRHQQQGWLGQPAGVGGDA